MNQPIPLEHYLIVCGLKQPAQTVTGCTAQVFLIQREKSHSQQQTAVPQYLALKFLPANATQVQQQLLKHEIEVLKAVRTTSEQIMQYVADGVLPENNKLLQHAGCYLLTPFYAGGSLRDYIQQQTLDSQQAFALFEQMLQAVAALHVAGYIHLDIKPSNFLFKQSDGAGLILADFALAQPVGKHQLIDGPQHQAAVVQGTPRYMSPEQFLGQHFNPQTDFYAMGVVLYEMLAGQALFSASTYQQWAVQHCQQAVPLLPEPLQRWQPLLDGLLAKKRQYRFKTIDAIQRCLHSSGIQ